ncbi:MAG TPA: hypothetical protein VNY36_06310 [Bacteroidia bacterium]|nr:hypothetical protein [Bacteroidia bacterium]
MRNHSVLLLLLCSIPLLSLSQSRFEHWPPYKSYFDKGYSSIHKIKELVITDRLVGLKSKNHPTLDSEVVTQKEFYDSLGSLVKLMTEPNSRDSELFQYSAHYQYDNYGNIKTYSRGEEFLVYTNFYRNGKIIKAIIKDSFAYHKHFPEVYDSVYIITYSYNLNGKLATKKCIEGKRQKKIYYMNQIFGTNLMTSPEQNEYESYSYNRGSNIASYRLIHFNHSKILDTTVHEEYLYTALGRKIKKIEYKEDTISFITTYTYDKNGRLILEKIFKKDTISYISVQSVYDTQGCRLKDIIQPLEGYPHKFPVEILYAYKFW